MGILYPYLDCHRHGRSLGYVSCIHVRAGAKITQFEEATEEAAGVAICEECAKIDFEEKDQDHLLITCCSGCLKRSNGQHNKDTVMPLSDGYESEKKLKEIAEQMAPALTTVLDEVERERYDFILFVVDLQIGAMQYISGLDGEGALKSVEQWCIRRRMDLDAKKQRSNPDSSSRPS